MNAPNVMRPFTTFWDVNTERYCIFAPDGCILANGEKVAVSGAVNGNVDLGFSTLPDALYAHVTKVAGSSGSSDGYIVEFDRNETKGCAKWSFKVADFGEEGVDVGYDVATGIVSLGGGEVELDEVSVDFTEASSGSSGDEKKVEIKGFAAASPLTVPRKSSDGSALEWVSIPDDKDTITEADENSISREYVKPPEEEGSSATIEKSNIVQIKGFGTFLDSSGNVMGTYEGSSDMEVGELDYTDAEFLVRIVGSSDPGCNSLGYRRVRTLGLPEPFKFTETTNGGVTVRELTNCQFSFNGVMVSLNDVGVSADTTYYLNSSGAVDQSTGAVSWTHSVGSSAISGDLTSSVKLYDIGNDGRPTKDYRAASIEVARPDSAFIWNNEPIGHVLADDDIDIGTKTIVGCTASGITVTESEDQILITNTDAGSSLVAGPGIIIDSCNSNAVTLNADNATIETKTGVAANGEKVVQLAGIGNIGCHATTYSLEEEFAIGCASPSAGLGTDKIVCVAQTVGGGYAVRYKGLGDLKKVGEVSASSGSGLEITTCNGARVIDFAGRNAAQIGIRDVTIYDSDGTALSTAKVVGSGNVVVPGIAAGGGISVATNGNTKVVSAAVTGIQAGSSAISVSQNATTGVVTVDVNVGAVTPSGGGGASSAYTGSMTVCYNMRYDTTSFSFIADYMTFQVNNGLVMPNPASSSANVFTAVEETV